MKTTGFGAKNFRAALAVGLLAAAGPVALSQNAPKADKKADQKMVKPATDTITDPDLTGAVERQLRRDTTVPADGIDVKVDRGVVTLTGSVDSLAAKDRAGDVARDTRGARSVTNRITVRSPAGRSDDAVRYAVVSALAADPATDSYEMATQVSSGVVTLTGTVESWAERDLAGRVARRVRGVTDVRNELKVNTPANRPDAEIAADVRGRLKWDRRVDASKIDVKVSGGKVTLSGTVGTATERYRAYADAWVGGVAAVNYDGLTVDRWWDRTWLRGDTVDGTRSDADIEKAVENAFLYDPRVYSFNPTVSVTNGVVTLTGTVNNYAAKWAAGADARNTVGVKRVWNLLKVRPATPRTDADIARDVRSALLHDTAVDRYQITVTAYNGRVSLSGTVDSYTERYQAEQVASRVDGVVDVRNYLIVGYPYSYYPINISRDLEIKDDIEDELVWSPWVQADEVTVTVRDGVATLNGVVGNLWELQSATENALEGGARGVVNNLTVRSDPDLSRSK